MSVSLKKGQKISLTKDNAGLKNVMVGLGWDQAKKAGGFLAMFKQTQEVDCDASALVLTEGKLKTNNDIVYFGNLTHRSNCVIHKGDNLTGAGEGDDEQIFICLDKLPEEFDKIVMVANIYQAVERKQHFGMIENAFIRVVDTDSKTELCKFNLTDDYSDMTAMVFGEIYRHNGEWKFNAVGEGTKDASLGELSKRF